MKKLILVLITFCATFAATAGQHSPVKFNYANPQLLVTKKYCCPQCITYRQVQSDGKVLQASYIENKYYDAEIAEKWHSITLNVGEFDPYESQKVYHELKCLERTQPKVGPQLTLLTKAVRK